MKKLILTIALLINANLAIAEELTEKIESFLSSISAENSDSAVDDFLANSSIAQMKPQDITMLKSQIKLLPGLYGKSLGAEIISAESLSPSLKRYVYITKYETNPVAWEFYFYKPHDKWKLNTINFNDNIPSLVGAKK